MLAGPIRTQRRLTNFPVTDQRSCGQRPSSNLFGPLPMTKPPIPLGLVFSRTGPYAMMAGEMEKSALMAVDEVNQSEEFDFSFTPHLRDPGGVVPAYHTACED